LPGQSYNGIPHRWLKTMSILTTGRKMGNLVFRAVISCLKHEQN
jgi:hypothetical protein